MSRGTLTAVYGPMFSGKTIYLIQQFGNGANTVVFKPSIDDRYTNRPAVVSSTKKEIPSVMVSHGHPEEMLQLVDDNERVFIDEANLFAMSLVTVVSELVNQGKQVYVSGLVLDSERNVWGPMTQILEMADEKVEVFARCDGDEGTCKNPATLSYRKIPKSEQVKVAGSDEYGACCETHYLKLHQPPKAR
jgi:thymidine kinase